MAVPPETINTTTTTTTISSAPNSSHAGDNHSNLNQQPTSSHRLPTIAASEAFRDLSEDDNHPPSNVYTGITELDDALGGGFESGKVTELWGPPGAGKTAIALTAAASVLQKGSSVVWIDTTHPLSHTRTQTTLPQASLQNLHQFHTPTLSHLLTLLLHPPTPFPPPTTHLLILTNLHTLLETSNPRNPLPPTNPTTIPKETLKWASTRRQTLLGTLSSLLNQLATRHDLAVIVTTGCATRMVDSGGGSGSGRLTLVPGVGGPEWDGGVWGRAGVWRDFGVPGRWVGVEKVRGGRVDDGGGGRVVGFEVSEGGGAVAVARREADGEGLLPSPSPVAVRGRKRTAGEIADSDDEEGEEVGDEFGGWAGFEEGEEEGLLGGLDGIGNGNEGDDAATAAVAGTGTGDAKATIIIDD